eukprot:5483927-Amphidinium_carterae.3
MLVAYLTLTSAPRRSTGYWHLEKPFATCVSKIELYDYSSLKLNTQQACERLHYTDYRCKRNESLTYPFVRGCIFISKIVLVIDQILGANLWREIASVVMLHLGGQDDLWKLLPCSSSCPLVIFVLDCLLGLFHHHTIINNVSSQIPKEFLLIMMNNFSATP